MPETLRARRIDRRKFNMLVAGFPFVASGMARAETPVGIGLTPVFLDDQFTFLEVLRSYLQARLQREVRFFQRGSYSEIQRLLQDGRIDFAWMCGFPYWRNRDWMKLVAVPLYNKEPVYQSYQICGAQHKNINKFEDLKGSVFAFSDPDSNSGFLYPTWRLRSLGLDAKFFFGRFFFTGSHRRIVEAVAVQLADGGSVDGYVWDVLSQTHPDLTGRTRIFEKSPKFGFPPFVAGADVDADLLRRFQKILIDMGNEPDGKQLLQVLMLDGFTVGEPSLFVSIGDMIADL